MISEKDKDNFYAGDQQTTRGGILLDMLLTNKNEHFEDVKTEASLGCSEHEMMNLNNLRKVNKINSRITTYYLKN